MQFVASAWAPMLRFSVSAEDRPVMLPTLVTSTLWDPSCYLGRTTSTQAEDLCALPPPAYLLLVSVSMATQAPPTGPMLTICQNPHRSLLTPGLEQRAWFTHWAEPLWWALPPASGTSPVLLSRWYRMKPGSSQHHLSSTHNKSSEVARNLSCSVGSQKQQLKLRWTFVPPVICDFQGCMGPAPGETEGWAADADGETFTDSQSSFLAFIILEKFEAQEITNIAILPF